MASARTDTYLNFERSLDRLLGRPLLLVSRLLRMFLKKGRSAERRPSILLIKLHGIGNLVMMVPAVRALRRAFPDCELHLLTFDTNREVLKILEEIDRGIFLERKNLRSLALTAFRFLLDARRTGYDAVLDFEQFAYISSILSNLACPAGVRIGFDNPSHNRRSAYNTPVAYIETQHMSGIFMEIVKALGVKVPSDLPPRLSVKRSERAEALELLCSSGVRPEDVLVLVHPGTSANLVQRRWPPERFARLADMLVDGLGVKVLFTGTEEEKGLIGSVLAGMKHEAGDLSGSMTLPVFTELIGISELVIANDTAAVHLADAAGTPVAGLYGPNTPFLYGPGNRDRNLVFYKKLPCSPCLRNTSRKTSDCTSPRCMESITVREVSARIRSRYFDSEGRILPVFKRDRAPFPNMDKRLTVA